MDIKKYITNKELVVSNDDIDLERLTNDLRKGYELSSEVQEKVENAVKEANTNSKKSFDELQSKYDEIEKRNVDLTENVRKYSLENTMIKQGFKEEQFDKVSQMRTSMYGDIKDDTEAVSTIAKDFNATFFPKVEEPKPKDDMPINNGTVKPVEPKVDRTTSIRSLIRK